MSDIISYFLIFSGLVMVVTAVIGCNNLPDYFCKMHAAALGDAVGCPLILFGIALRSEHGLKIALLAVILLIVNPVASYILNRIALHSLPFEETSLSLSSTIPNHVLSVHSCASELKLKAASQNTLSSARIEDQRKDQDDV